MSTAAPPSAPERRRWSWLGGVRLAGRHRWIIVAAALVTLPTLLATVGYAAYTAQSPNAGNRFTGGRIDLGTTPTSTVMTYSGLLPGDVGAASSIQVSNAGSVQLHYAVTVAATDPDAKNLRSQLQLVIRTVDGTTPASPCNDFDGSQLYSGALTGTGGLLLGDPATGSQVGDRALSAASNEILCFRASLPLTSGNSYATATTAVTFTFSAEST